MILLDMWNFLLKDSVMFIFKGLNWFDILSWFVFYYVWDCYYVIFLRKYGVLNFLLIMNIGECFLFVLLVLYLKYFCLGLSL